jgi:hypothetical protein
MVGGGLAAAGIADRLLGFLTVIAIGAVTLLVLSIGHWCLRLPTSAGLNRRGLVAWCVGTSLGLGLTIAASDVALPASAAALGIYLVPVPRSVVL